jgi:lipoprotein NlpI
MKIVAIACVFALLADANLLQQAEEAWRRREQDAAIELATKHVAASPEDAKGYRLRAAMYEARREFEKAIADYDRLIKINAEDAAALQRRGGCHFRLGNVEKSIEDFDAYLRLEPGEKADHWQRGISLYYAGRFEDGEKQFELHKTVNPEDVENAAWHYLCAARRVGVEKARANLIPVKDDARKPMAQVQRLFAGQLKPEDVLKAATDDARAQFYAHLYIGLWHEAAGEAKPAKEHIDKAAALAPDEYMGDVARVHAKRLT